jgi:hypothetical protein
MLTVYSCCVCGCKLTKDELEERTCETCQADEKKYEDE